MSLRVRTRRPLARFRRAGVEFGPDWTELDEAALSDEQRAAILVEPRLEVELDEPVKRAKTTKATKATAE